MKVIIIAAGSATRLGDNTKEIPKGLLDINGKSILERQMTLFRKFGITDISIITGLHKEKFDFPEVRYIEDKKHSEHDVLGSLMAGRFLMTDDLLVSYSDILFDESVFQKMFHFGGDIGIAVDLEWEKAYASRTQHPREEADNVLIENNRILQIKKNITSDKEGEMIGEFVGVMKLSKKGCDIFVERYDHLEKTFEGKFQEAPSFKKAYLTDMLQDLIDNGVDVTPIIVDGRWCEIDTTQDLDRARREFH